MIWLLYLRARLLLQLGEHQLARSRRFDRRSSAALARSEVWMAAARCAADHLDQARRPRSTFPAGDLLHGSRAIAAHLGVPKGVAVHLIRSRQIPSFSLGGVACARRSTLAKHFAVLEASERP
ncbi:hypothetical protein [Methylobacterium radiotolerans]|uniref:hypothetical protein n=1 Tax=Methylobacterium radiotolerans TaxID=31998 RepID=UPI001F46A0C1|nr:hypothetical protein [Methylobacterium radiotolerans]UIY45855.1 hypothetical protein LZ599_32590 [Methylobacterium radiotolerans]